MTDEAIEPPSGPIDPNNPPTKPPTKPKGRSHDEAQPQEDKRPDQSEPTT